MTGDRKIQFLLNNGFTLKMPDHSDTLYIKAIPHTFFNKLSVEVDLSLNYIWVCCAEQYIPYFDKIVVIIKRDFYKFSDDEFCDLIKNILRIFSEYK